MQRIILGVEYDGARYSGWQRQRHHQSVQENLEIAVGKIAHHPIQIFCAGRTDAGVHASGQIVHFDTSAVRQDVAWVRGVNSHLSDDIRIFFAKPTVSHFDARRSALSRRYCYIIANQRVRPGILRNQVSWVLPQLDADLMQQGAQYLLGTHDFSSFRAAECQARTPIRHLQAISVTRKGDNVVVDVTANAFLHHMVRNIVGTLVPVGLGKYPPEFVQQVLAARDRRKALTTATPHGLYLAKVSYPDEFGLAETCNFPWFVS